MPDYFRGENISLVANYIDSAGRPLASGVSGVTVDLYYYGSDGSRTYYIQASGMTQDPVDTNRFYAYYTLPINAVETTTISSINAMYSGMSIQNTETFNVYAASSSGTYIGSVAVSGYVVDLSGTGIGSAAIQVSYLNGGSILTSTVTNSSGLYTVYLNPEDYLIIASAQNYLTNSVSETVTSGTSTFPSITLLSSAGTGATSFSDTYVYVDPNTGAHLPITNLKVTLYAAVSAPTLTQPLSTTRTDVNGTFVFTANNGDYVLKIEGNGPNNTVFDTAYDIEVSDAFTGGSPDGFRYKGTSQYTFI